MKKLQKKYLEVFRRCQNSKGLFQKYNRFVLHFLSIKTQIQIPYTTTIGKNFCIGHLGSVIINPKTTIGDNVCVYTGVTIGQENRGERQGCPTIGNNVWIGTNAVIVGKINIGDDVMIAPNSFVNFDVPSHSIVVGNPATIHHKDKATEGYLKVNQ